MRDRLMFLSVGMALVAVVMMGIGAEKTSPGIMSFAATLAALGAVIAVPIARRNIVERRKLREGNKVREGGPSI